MERWIDGKVEREREILTCRLVTKHLRYGQSSLFEQTTPSVVELVDNNASVSGAPKDFRFVLVRACPGVSKRGFTNLEKTLCNEQGRRHPSCISCDAPICGHLQGFIYGEGITKQALAPSKRFLTPLFQVLLSPTWTSTGTRSGGVCLGPCRKT